MRNPGKMKIYVKKHGKLAVKVMNISKDPSKKPSIIVSQKEEIILFKSMKKYVEKVFRVKVSVKKESDKEKSKQAMPGKPAIIIV